MGPLGYSFFGLTPEGSGTYVQPDVTSTDKTDGYGVSISFARAGSSNTKPRFDAAYMRLYAGNTLTVTAPAGATLRKIVFTEPATGKSWAGSMTPDQGSYVEKTWYATTDDVTEVVFTDDGTKQETQHQFGDCSNQVNVRADDLLINVFQHISFNQFKRKDTYSWTPIQYRI